MLNKLFGKQNKTFKPVKLPPKDGNKQKLSNYANSEYAKATLGSGNMKSAVALPKNEDLNEWLAVNTVDFFNEINLLYGTISEYCTATTCPQMKAGDNFEYYWMDGVKYKKPTQVTAPEYVDLLMSWVEAQLNDESIFPLQLGTPFPKDFQPRVKKIFQRLFRVYAHVYHSHFDKIVSMGAEAHLNTCFKHFIYFVYEFSLVEKEELGPLKSHISALMGTDAPADDEKTDGDKA